MAMDAYHRALTRPLSPMPINEGDGATKSYVDAPLGSLKKQAYMRDEFVGGDASTSTASLGDLGWQFGNGAGVGTLLKAHVAATSVGGYLITTGASSGDRSFVQLLSQLYNFINTGWEAYFYFSTMTSLANKTVRIGMMDGEGDPPSNGLYLERLDTDTNMFLVTRAGGAQTRLDTGLAWTDSLAVRAQFRRTPTGVGLIVNDQEEVISTVNIPGSLIGPVVWQVKTTTAAGRTLGVDGWEFRVSGLNR